MDKKDNFEGEINSVDDLTRAVDGVVNENMYFPYATLLENKNLDKVWHCLEENYYTLVNSKAVKNWLNNKRDGDVTEFLQGHEKTFFNYGLNGRINDKFQESFDLTYGDIGNEFEIAKKYGSSVTQEQYEKIINEYNQECNQFIKESSKFSEEISFAKKCAKLHNDYNGLHNTYAHKYDDFNDKKDSEDFKQFKNDLVVLEKRREELGNITLEEGISDALLEFDKSEVKEIIENLKKYHESKYKKHNTSNESEEVYNLSLKYLDSVTQPKKSTLSSIRELYYKMDDISGWKDEWDFR